MNAVLDCTYHYIKPEFAGQVDWNLMLWLHNGFRRMKCKPGESAETHGAQAAAVAAERPGSGGCP